MIGYAKIAGGTASSVKSLVNHLDNQTLKPEMSRLEAYYQRGGADHDDLVRSAVIAWRHAGAEPDMNRLAEFSFHPGPFMDAEEIRQALVDQYDVAIAGAERMASGTPALTAEARELHGLPEPPIVARYLQGLSVADLEGRKERAQEQWDTAWQAAAYRADVADAGDDPSIAVIRPDLHPAVAIGLGIDTTRPLTSDEIGALIAGRKADGSLVEGKNYAKVRETTNERTGERTFSTPIGSYDFCPTPDKSVSVAWAFAPEVEKAQIYNAHIESAREAVAFLAQHVGMARYGKGGQGGSEPGHVGWLEFTHHTARKVIISGDKVEDKQLPGDPDLHTHFLMQNAVFCASGRVGSLDTAALKGLIFEADAFYHARLGHKLRDAGFEVALDERTGAARMPIVPDEVRTLMSKRTNIGDALARKYTADRGEAWEDLTDDQRADRMKNATQSLDQKVKGGKDDIADFENWRLQAKELGWEPKSLQLYGPALPLPDREQRHRLAYEQSLPWLAEKLEHSAVLGKHDVRVAALRQLVNTGIDGHADVDAVTQIMRDEGVSQYGGKTALVWGQETDKRHVSVTTELHESDEKEFIRLAKAAAADRTGGIAPELIKQKIERSGLDFTDTHGRNQRSVIERLADGGRFGVALGTAGAGKTTMLKPIVASWKEEGRKVMGASLAWRQADDLVDAGIDKGNVRAFPVLIKGLKDGTIHADRMTAVAVDELGMLGTRQGLELLRLREKHGFTIVALGDDKQCSSIQAGEIIALSRRALGAEQVPEILTTKRQQSEREQQIVKLFRDGRPGEALEMKRSDGSAEMVQGGRDGVIKRVAELYLERLHATGQAPTISAPTNTDAHQISERIRVERRNIGQIGEDLLQVRATDGDRNYPLKLAKGDRVRLFASTRADFLDGRNRAIGRNGSVLDVVAVNQRDGIVARNADGDTGLIHWKDLTRKDGRALLAYGDATTIHTAQGSTSDEHIFALPSGSQHVSGGQAYTAGTRHRIASYLVTNEIAERLGVRESRPLNDPNEITLDDKWANVAKHFVGQTKTDSALSLIEQARNLGRGSVRVFQQALRPTDPRLEPGPIRAPDLSLSRTIERGLHVAQQAIHLAKERVRERYVGRSMGMSR